jgi:WD40 repeat protein
LLEALNAFGSSRFSSSFSALGRDEAALADPDETFADVRMVPSTSLGAEVVCTAIDGKSHLVAAADLSGDVRVWDYETGHEVYYLPAPSGTGVTATRRTRLAFAPRGKLLAVGDRVGRLWLVEVGLRKVEKLPLRRGAALALAFDESAGLMVVATTAGVLELWEVPNRKQLARFTFDPDGEAGEVLQEPGGIQSVDLSPGRHFLAAGTTDGVIHVWNFRERDRSSRLQPPPAPPDQSDTHDPTAPAVYLRFSPNEKRLAVVRKSGWLEVWRPEDRSLEYRVLLPEPGTPRRVYYAPDGGQIIVLWDTGSIVLIDPNDGSIVDRIKIPRGRAVNLSHGDDGVPVASLGSGSTVQVWDLLQLGRLATLGPFPTHLLDVTVTPFNTALALSSGGFVDHWDLCTGRHLGRQDLGASSLRELHKGPHPGVVLSCGPRDGLIALTGLEKNGATLRRDVLPVPAPATNERVATYSVGPDSTTIVLGYESGDVRLYTYGDSSVPPRFLPPSDWPITTVCFSPDGGTLAVADARGCLRLIDVETGNVQWEDQSGTLPIRMVAFTPSGRLLSVPRGNSIEVWNLEKNRRVARLTGHDAPIRTLVHGLEGRLLLSASEDGTARLWDMAQQRSLRVLADHPGPVTAATLDPELRLLLTTSGPYLSVWRVSDAKLLARLCYCGPRDAEERFHHWTTFTSAGYYVASHLDPPHVEFYRPESSSRMPAEDRRRLFDPLTVARTLLADV